MKHRGRRAKRTIGQRAARVPLAVWVTLGLAALIVVNGGYQLARKPSELLGLVVPASAKTPATTWAEYGPLFRAHSTGVMQPSLLAALAQVESAGNPVARTYWRWQWSLNPFRVYAPASSAVGMFQLTDEAFAEAQHLCIRDHAVAREGAWDDPRACWLTGWYFRSLPSHAIEMTSAWLDQAVADTLAEQRISRPTLEQKQRLAAVIHLCGRARGAMFARHGFRLHPGERCGDHDPGRYLAQVQALRIAFARLDARG